MNDDEKRAIEAQIRYLGEAEARLSGVKARLKGAQHFMRRRKPEYASEELLHVIAEARRLRLHLCAWDHYVIKK